MSASRNSSGTSSGLPAPEVVVPAADVAVEVSRGNAADLVDVLVAPVSRRRDHADATAGYIQPLHQLAHRLDRGRIVAVVEDDLERMLVVDVHPPGGLEERGIERPEPVADVLQLEAHAERHRRRKHRVLHVVDGPAFERGRNQVGPEERDVRAMIVDRDHLTLDTCLQYQPRPPALMCSPTSSWPGSMVT